MNPPCPSFFFADPTSSLYREVARQLKEERGWTEAPNNKRKVDVLLAHRQDKSWGILGSRCRLVNYYRSRHTICQKATLVKTLRNAAAAGLPVPRVPQTFVLKSYGELQAAAEQSAEASSSSVQQSAQGVPPWRLSMGAKSLVKGALPDERNQWDEFARTCDFEFWIAKSTGGAHGSQVHIKTRDELLRFVDTYAAPVTWAVQRYVERPFLLDRRKFDIRSWALLDPSYRIFLFSESSFRMASEPYDMTQVDNKVMHITNHCVQVTSPNYGLREAENELFYADVERLLTAEGTFTLRDLLPQIEECIVNTFRAAHDLMHHDSASVGYDCFQLFGFDFILDSSFVLHLLEVNSSPACAARLNAAVARALIDVAIEPLFGRSPTAEQPSPTGASPHFRRIG